MTTAKDEATHTQIEQFTLTRQTECFISLKDSRFSGRLIISDSHDNTWTFYLYLGSLVYATGGRQQVRRWRRNLIAYCPERLANICEIQSTLASVAPEELRTSWEYELLAIWVEQNKITRDRANKIVKATIVEILFDIIQALDVSWQTIKDDLLPTSLGLIDPERVIDEANRLWQAWQNARIADRSPNMAPVIRQPEALQQRTTTKVYQNLVQLLDGKQTLRDLSIRMKRDIVTITRSLLPYVQLGLVQLIEIEDISSPVPDHLVCQLNATAKSRSRVIACIDDSPLICQTLETIVTQAGYQFVSETDGLRAIAVLLSHKPDAIFLDLVMPNTNGYEICSQLRKLSFFRNTPIIILTGNDGIVDRVRAKMVGSTDFIGKPVEAELVLAKLDKYLDCQVRNG